MKSFKKIQCFSIYFVFIFVSSAFAESNSGFVYSGRILKPDRTPINSGTLSITVSVFSPAPNSCLLYKERFSGINMLNSNGTFSVTLGLPTPLGTRLDTTGYSFNQIISNAGFTFTGLACGSGTTFTPTATDERVLSATFDDGVQVVTIDDLKIKSVPYAMQANQINGYGIMNLAKISGAGSALVLTPLEYDFLKNFSAPASASALPCAANEVVQMNATGTAWICSGAGSGTTESTTVSNMGATGAAIGALNGTVVELKKLIGTANQVTVTQNTDDITFSLPQNIHSAATPTFATPTAAGHAVIKSYADANILGLPLSAPIAGNVGQAVRWNAAGTAWEYFTPTLGLAIGATSDLALSNSGTAAAPELSIASGTATGQTLYWDSAAGGDWKVGAVTYPMAAASVPVKSLLVGDSATADTVVPLLPPTMPSVLLTNGTNVPGWENGAANTFLKGSATGVSWSGIALNSSDVSGTLTVDKGGTGQSTFATGEILVGNTTGNTLSKVTMGGDATIGNTGTVTVQGIRGKSVNATAASFNGQFYQYESTGGTWVLNTTAGAPAVNDILKWNDGTKRWEPGAPATFNNLSPMTTLGDTIYGAAAGAATRLPGNITTTKQFLTQTGTGAASAAPTWGVPSLTDVSTGTTNAALYINAAGALTATAMANGQILIGSGVGAPQPATITGTANQVTVTNGSNSITLSLPQNINTAATPTFATPTAAGHAVIKSYADANILGLPLAAPAAGNITQSPRWNAAGTAWEYFTPQVRVASTCAAGSSIRVIAADGTVTCETDDNAGGTVTSVTGTAPVVSSGGTTPAISMAAATSLVPGYLTAADWTTFNNKQTRVAGTCAAGSSIRVIAADGTVTCEADDNSGGTVTSVTGTAPVVSSGGATPAISMAAATSLVPGYLTAADWTTFNGKQNRVTGTCAAGSSISSIAADGTVGCEVDNDAAEADTLASVTGRGSTTTSSVTVGAGLTTGSGISTGDAMFELGGGRTGDGNAYIDFHTQSGTDYDLRIIRGGGANGAVSMVSTGTGNVDIAAGNGTGFIRIQADGNVGIGQSSAGAKLDVPGLIHARDGIYFGNSTVMTTMGISNDFGGNTGLTIAGGSSYTRFVNSGNTLEAMRINQNGNVGINTADPNVKFHVQGGGSTGIARFTTSDYDYITPTGSGIIISTVLDTGNSNTIINAYTQGFSAWGDLILQNNNSNTGKVGIGTPAPGYKLDVQGGNVNSAGAYTNVSDLRMKEKIEPLQNTLDKILHMQSVSYYWKDKSFDSTKQVGFIAQEVEKIFPEVVKTDDRGFKAMSYSQLASPIVAAIKEFYAKWFADSEKLHAEIEAVKKENQMLKDYLCEKDPQAPMCARSPAGN